MRYRVVNKDRARDSRDRLMAYLRLVHSNATLATREGSCLDAFDRELDYLFETLRRLGAHAWELEDLAQEVFIVLYRNWPSFDTTRPVQPYLFGVAFRIVSAHCRRRDREVPHPTPELEDETADPEEALIDKESFGLFIAALERVPLRRRAVLILHDLDEVPIVEVARKLSLTRVGAYVRLRKARAELAAAVKRLLKEET